MTDTDLSNWLMTYTRVPAGFTATPKGRSPTVTFVTRGRVAVGSTTDTLLDMKFEMYANGAAAAADATASDSASTATRIPETRLVPENPLGSGHLVFMPPRECSDDARRESRIRFGAYTRT